MRSSCPTAMLCLAILLASQSVQAAVITFQEGQNGYSGTADTYTAVQNPTTNFGNSGGVEIQGSSFQQGFLRFDDIVGSGANQVAAGSTINAVTLSLSLFNLGANTTVNRLLIGFDEHTTTFSNAYGGDGASANDIEATSASVTLTNSNFANLDITSLASCWFDLSCANEGLVFSNYFNNTDAMGFYSSDDGLPGVQPQLIVDYTPSAVPVPASAVLLFAGIVFLVAGRRRI